MLTLPLDVDSLPHLGAAEPTDADVQRALSRTHLVRGRTALMQDLDLAWSIALDRRAVDLEAYVGDLMVWSATLSRDQPCATWRDSQGRFKEELTFCVDLELGEITVTGDACVFAGGTWKCYRFPTAVLA